MKVYIVEHGESCEGGDVLLFQVPQRILGVFATFKLALDHAKDVPCHFPGGWKEESLSEKDKTARWENGCDYVSIFPMRVIGI
jgi:hypothetical protein